MKQFLDKLKNQEYISKVLYLKVLNTNKEVIPNHFDLDKYNNDVLEKLYLKYKDYFENMYKGIDDNICLDKEQIKAILADEDYSLIIAGAGSGKTTTMASKVKYLVDIKKIDPSKIIVMSYTKKATEELEKRIVYDFKIPARVTTFHSLGLMYTRTIFKNHKCYVVDDHKRQQIFLKYFKEYLFKDKNKIKEIITLFDPDYVMRKWVFGRFFRDNYDKYPTFDEYFNAYKEFKLSEVKDLDETIHDIIDHDLNQESIHTIKGELVRSKGEAIIANFLYTNNIEYDYEKIYPHLMNERKTYRPDFTLNLAGEDIYIEYFGLNNKKYKEIQRLKEQYHKEHHNKFISLEYSEPKTLINDLKNELIKMGFKLKPKTQKEIYFALLDRYPSSQFFPFENLMYEVIDAIKSHEDRKDYREKIIKFIKNQDIEYQDIYLKQLKYINDFYVYYQKCLFGSVEYGFDFSDMIYYANKYIHSIHHNDQVDYLIIDEYQDISKERYIFAKNILNKSNAKIVAVGDDWQSIFSFAGSKIEYIYNFLRYFPGAKLLKISQTYRNSQELIKYCGEFIMKNNTQIKKELISQKDLSDPIKFVLFEPLTEYQVLKRLILKIHKQNKDHNILILGRTNAIIDACYLEPEFKDELGTKLKFVGYEDIDIDAMTIHKSKGLTADEVIIIGLNKSFPKKDHHDFWMLELFKEKLIEEDIAFAEERRLFYVALTRTKNRVYLLVNRDPKLRSFFVNELYNIIKEER